MNTTRRNFLKATGATLALPWLDSIHGFAHAAHAKAPPQRLLMICLPLGIYREALIPEEAGAKYKTTEYLSVIDDFHDRYTVISGLDHPGVNGGHSAEPRIFTGIPSHQKNVRSLDQYLASQIGQETRFDSLVLSAGRNEFSWTESGTIVPSEPKMSRVYAKLFGQEDKAGPKKCSKRSTRAKALWIWSSGRPRPSGQVSPRPIRTSSKSTSHRFAKRSGDWRSPNAGYTRPSPKSTCRSRKILRIVPRSSLNSATSATSRIWRFKRIRPA